jgi:hypothetical protein
MKPNTNISLGDIAVSAGTFAPSFARQSYIELPAKPVFVSLMENNQGEDHKSSTKNITHNKNPVSHPVHFPEPERSFWDSLPD